jgi:hypothetical protein
MSEGGAATASPFQAARDRAAAKALAGGEFLSAEERASMHTEGTPFWVVAASVKESKEFGPRASFVIVLDPAQAANGEFSAETSRTLDLGLSPFREALIAELQPLIQAQKVVGPLYLDKRATSKGRDAWDIVDTPLDGKIPY